MLELEKTYLAKQLPEGLDLSQGTEIEDTYIPVEVEHPKMRLRRTGDKYVLTKKIRLDEADASKQEELNVELSAAEYQALVRSSNRHLHKIRYRLDYRGHTAEIDIFQGALDGLVLVDFEFDSIEEQTAFEMPDFCLADVTQEDFVAGGMLAGRSYEDIVEDLQRFDYKKSPA
ncbi:hypothetical protein KKF05_04745 [Patescibacteria group bacterium]|nr:hypothetical protein [Patescibacteria group bacterium]MBU1916092.1 hypothetical protein [Patescibacteria group bacterium]